MTPFLKGFLATLGGSWLAVFGLTTAFGNHFLYELASVVVGLIIGNTVYRHANEQKK